MNSDILQAFLNFANNKTEITSSDGSKMSFRYAEFPSSREICIGIAIDGERYSVSIIDGKIYRLYIAMDEIERCAYLPDDACIQKLEKFFF